MRSKPSTSSSPPPALEVLVVEDDPDTRANFCDILELDSYPVTTAGSAAEVRALNDWSRFSVIILDRRLPDGNAEELLPLLRRAAPEAEIVIVTGYSDLDGALSALRLGAADYLLKPVNPDALRASLHRIDEHRRLLSEKRRSEAMFRALVEAAPCMILILTPDHRVTYFSPYAEAITGFAAEQAVGRPLAELLGGGPHLAEDLQRALQETPSREPLVAIPGRGGDRRWIMWRTLQVMDSAGAPALLVVGHDITNLRDAQERALQAERLAAIGQMVTVLAHESRSDLQAIRWYLELLRPQVDKPEALQLMDRLRQAGEHLDRLYSDLRGYAAPICLDRQPQPLRAALAAAWEHLEPRRRQHRASLQLTGKALDDPFTIDLPRMTQVFRNIFENSFDACPQPAKLRVRARTARLDGVPAVALTVSDNGSGLNPEQRNRIFEPFFTTKSQGTGLGMAIARRIVELHGGRIEAGEPGDDEAGARIHITLPEHAM